MLRVRAPGRVVAPTVVLYPTENESECDCPARVSPCEHVAAAAISLSAPKEEGAAPAERPVARVGYRFTRGEGGLRLARVLVEADGSETPLGGALASRLADPAQAARLQVEDVDLRADALLEAGGAAANRGVLLPTKLDGLMRILTGAGRIQLDGVPVAISEEEILPVATLTDAAGPAGAAEVRLTIAADPRVRAAVAAGVVLCEDDGRGSLHRLGETELGGVWLQNLPQRRSFAAAEMGELVTVVLPDLARRAALDVRSNRLPAVVRNLAPRIVLQLDQTATGLSVLPALVYGSPPVARIDAGKLVYLRGPVPLRDVPAEGRAVERLRAELDLLPGRRTSYDGADAPRFVAKLGRWRGDLAGDAAGIVKPAASLEPRLRVITEGEPGRESVRFELTFTPVGGGAGKTPGGSVDAAAVVRAWQEGLGIVPLGEGRLGVAADRLAGKTRRARRRSAGRARGRRPPGAAFAPRPRRAVRRAGAPAPARPRSAGPARRRVRASPRGAAAARSHGDAARVPAPGGRAGSPSCAAPAWAACSPTTWASARPCRRCARSTGRRWSSARRASCSTGRRSWRASGPASRCRCITGRRAPSMRPPT